MDISEKFIANLHIFLLQFSRKLRLKKFAAFRCAAVAGCARPSTVGPEVTRGTKERSVAR